MMENKKKPKGLAFEELEAQSAVLLPSRIEMRRRRRRRTIIVNNSFNNASCVANCFVV